jgi:hypothetical protein
MLKLNAVLWDEYVEGVEKMGSKGARSSWAARSQEQVDWNARVARRQARKQELKAARKVGFKSR